MAVELSSDARRWLTRAPEIINIVLVALVALAAARLVWLVWPEPPGYAVAPADASPNTNASVSQSIDIDAIAGAHLFGRQPAKQAKPDATQQIKAPETHLNLVLTGIVSATQSKRSRALIKNPKGKQDKYKVGQAIVSGVKLHAIYTQRVILDRSGHYETLTLNSVKKARQISGVQSTQAAASSQRDQTVQRSPPAASDRVDRKVSGDVASQIGEVRQKILAHPSSAQHYIRLRPARQNGNLVGYRIYPGANKALFKKAGLKSGELVTAINGKPLDSPAASLRLLGNLAHANRATVTLKHNGQARTVQVDFQ